MNTPTLSRSECNVLRGLAIIGIFLHNYCHWIGSIVKENEYQYFQHNVDWLNQCFGERCYILCQLCSRWRRHVCAEFEFNWWWFGF